MPIKSTQNSLSVFPITKPQNLSKKVKQWLLEKRLCHLQQRIDAIEDALRYELKQNYPFRRKQQLIHSADKMCLILAHKQKRLLQKHPHS